MMEVVTADGGRLTLGTVETGCTVGIIDYSRRVTDDFGVTTVVQRGFARRLSVRLAIETDAVSAVQRRLADLRATSARWIADDRFEWLSPTGFYKDFDIDVAFPPLSYCTLSVEGLAETAPAADPGGDPAPDGRPSTLQLLQPYTVTEAILTASSVAEDDAPAWAAGVGYTVGARVLRQHRVYEALVANTGADPLAVGGQWLDTGPSKRWAPFDQALGTVAQADGLMTMRLDTARIEGVALLDVTGATVRVQADGYDRTQAVTGGAVTFLDLGGKARVTVTIAGAGSVSVGTLLIGRVVALGTTEASPTAGITDFSRKDVDDFGEVAIVKRGYAKRMTAKALIRTDALDIVANRIATVRAMPSLWIGQDGLDCLTVYGFFRDFGIEVGAGVSKLSLSIEGLSAADKPAAIVNWEDVGDPKGTKPKPHADQTSKNTSKDTAAISGRPVALVIAQLDEIKEIDPIKTDVSALTQVTIAHDAALGALGRVDEAQAAALEKLAGDTGRSLAVLDAAGVRRDAAQRDADEALGRLGDATLRALMEADRTRAVLRDAGIVVDPATGVVRIHAIDQVADRTSAVEVKLDAQASTIRSKASVDFVQEQIALAVLDPSQVAELEPLIRRMTTAETALDGLHATVALKADALELTRTAARLTSVGQSLDALAGTIDTKASRTDLDAQGLRLTDAEQRIAALPNGASVTTTLRQVGAAVDAAGEAALRGIVAGDDAHRSRIREIAEYREEAITRIDTGLAAESLARRVLAASMGALDARLTDQARTLVTTTAATAERVNALAVSSGAQAAAISSLQEATIDAAGGIARTERTIRQVAGVSEANADATLRALVAGDAAALAARTQLAQVQEEATTRLIAGEQSAAQTKLLLEAQLGAARALIGQTADTLATADRAAASRMDAIDVRVGAVSDTIAATQARVTREVEALASADAAQVRQIDAVALEVRDTGTGLAATRAMAIADARASADRDKAQVERIDAISVIAADAAAGIAEAREVSAEQGRGMTRLSTVLRQTAGQADDGAEAVLRALIAGDDASQARQRQIVQIQTEFTTQLVANEQASAIARQTLAARMGRAEGAIVDLTTVVSTLDAATAQRLSALEVAFAAQGKEIAATVARIAREEEARAAGDHAEALARQTLEARFAGDVGDVRAAIGDEARVRAAADQAEATARQTLEARVAGDIGEVRSAIGEEARVRAAADEAEATVRQTLQAQVGGLAKDVTAVAASIGEEARVRAQADQAEAEARRVLDAKINDPASGLEAAMAQIGAVDRARVSGDEASAESIRQVRAYLDGIGSVGLQTAFEALVTRTGKLEGRYTLAIDTNGRLQGFVLAGSQNGPASFSLIDTDFLMGKGKIVFDTGTYMKVQGVGFGAAKDLIEWFGPTMAIDKCSRANALEYRTTTGDAYFGGSLSAGTLRNPGQSSSLAADAVAEVPSFGSNGRPVKYVASWSYYREWTAQYAGTADGLKAFNAAVASFNAQSDDAGYTYFGAKNVEQPSSSITLTRSFGAAYQQLQQQSFTTQQQTMVGLKPITNGEPGNATFTASIGGGFTVLDPTQSTANRTLRLALARGFTLSDGVIQRLSIVAIEE